MKDTARRIYRRLRRTLGVPYQPPILAQLPQLTLLNTSYFLYQKRVFDIVRNLWGDIVECGIGHGVTFVFWAALCFDEGGRRRLWGFDSFEGFPEPTPDDRSPRGVKNG